MGLSLKACQRDRLSSLPDELLIQILSLIPTKFAVVVCVLLRKRVLLLWITALDFDSSPIRYCSNRPNQIERFPSFQTFVNSFLQAHQSPYLTSFRLNLGVCCSSNFWVEGCNLDLKSTQINAWITFPLTHCGLRELDLCIHVRGPPGRIQLPPQVFTKETLVVLKLNVNLSFDGISIFQLPNLKVLHLYAFFMPESGEAFLTSLVSNCPLLEELDVTAWWDNHVRSTKIASPSLRRLSLAILSYQDEDNSDLVVLDTPNLEYLLYLDNLALQYSITKMNRLVEATIDFGTALSWESPDVSCQQMLILIRALPNVRHLCLDCECPWILTHIATKKQLPVFHDLIILELDFSHGGSGVVTKLLVSFLCRSPNLETLVFPRGVDWSYYTEGLGSEELRSLTLSPIPWCCRFNLKRILVYFYQGSEKEIIFIQFLLKYSLVLEELVLFTNDPTMVASTLMDLPRASRICSINLQLHCDSKFPRLY